jgi:hypothetical protein
LYPHFWQERDCLSSGVYLLRRSAAVARLIEELWARGAKAGGGHYSEEALLADLAPGAAAKILLTEHRDLNSTATSGVWHGGGRDYVLHAAHERAGRVEVLEDWIARAESGTDWPRAQYEPQQPPAAVPATSPPPAAPAPPKLDPTPPLRHGFAA